MGQYTTRDVIASIIDEGVEYMLGNFQPGSRDKDDVYDELFVSPVTGNDSGSYSFNSYVSAERLSWELLEVFVEACEEWGQDVSHGIQEGPEYVEVTIRCYLLGQCISDILDELEDAGFFGDSDDEDEEE